MRASPIRVWVGLPLLIAVFGADVHAGEPAEAEDRTPLWIACLASLDATVELCRTLSDGAGDDELLLFAKDAVEKAVEAGVNLSRPIGIVVYGLPEDVPRDTDAGILQTLREDCSALVLIPLDDMAKLASAIPQWGQFQRTEGPTPEGDYRLVGEKATWHLVQRDDWALLASDQEHLSALPDDPLDLFEGLDQRYTFVARVDPRRAAGEKWQQMRADIAPDPDRTVMKAARELLPVWPELFDTHLELETYRLFGEALDDVETGLLAATLEKTGDFRQDTAFSARDGTVTAERIEALRGVTSRLVGLRDEDATALAALLEKMDLEISADRCQELGLEAEKVERLLKALASTGAATIRGRLLDGAMVGFEDDVVYVVNWADAQSLEQPLVDLINRPAHPSEETLSSGVQREEYHGVRLQGLTLPDESIVVGLAEDTLYLGIGDDCLKALKRVIDHDRKPSDSPAPVLDLSVNPGKIGSLEERLASDLLAGPISAAVGSHPVAEGSPMTIQILTTPDGLSLRFTVTAEAIAASREDAEEDQETTDCGDSQRQDTAPKAEPSAAEAE
jgi:hypothetical protein